jgi:hypothetical protein
MSSHAEPTLSADDALQRLKAGNERFLAGTARFPTVQTGILADLAKALDLLKSMASEEERERATVYMEGLAQMRRDWSGKQKKKKS